MIFQPGGLVSLNIHVRLVLLHLKAFLVDSFLELERKQSRNYAPAITSWVCTSQQIHELNYFLKSCYI